MPPFASLTGEDADEKNRAFFSLNGYTILKVRRISWQKGFFPLLFFMCAHAAAAAKLASFSSFSSSSSSSAVRAEGKGGVRMTSLRPGLSSDGTAEEGERKGEWARGQWDGRRGKGCGTRQRVSLKPLFLAKKIAIRLIIYGRAGVCNCKTYIGATIFKVVKSSPFGTPFGRTDRGGTSDCIYRLSTSLPLYIF